MRSFFLSANCITFQMGLLPRSTTLVYSTAPSIPSLGCNLEHERWNHRCRFQGGFGLPPRSAGSIDEPTYEKKAVPVGTVGGWRKAKCVSFGVSTHVLC